MQLLFGKEMQFTCVAGPVGQNLPLEQQDLQGCPSPPPIDIQAKKSLKAAYYAFIFEQSQAGV